MYTNKDENTNGAKKTNAEQILLQAVSPVIVNAIALTEKEVAVLGALLGFQMGRDVSKVARRAGLARMTTLYTLKKLEKRGLVFKTLHKKTYWWRYKRGLEFMKRSKGGKNGAQLRRGEGTIPLPIKK